MSRMLAMSLLLLLASGCAGRSGGWGMPWGQGTTDQQKARAVKHDPYPLNDIGPEVVGGRPREYYQPQAEPVRQNLNNFR